MEITVRDPRLEDSPIGENDVLAATVEIYNDGDETEDVMLQAVSDGPGRPKRIGTIKPGASKEARISVGLVWTEWEFGDELLVRVLPEPGAEPLAEHDWSTLAVGVDPQPERAQLELAKRVYALEASDGD